MCDNNNDKNEIKDNSTRCMGDVVVHVDKENPDKKDTPNTNKTNEINVPILMGEIPPPLYIIRTLFFSFIKKIVKGK